MRVQPFCRVLVLGDLSNCLPNATDCIRGRSAEIEIRDRASGATVAQVVRQLDPTGRAWLETADRNGRPIDVRVKVDHWLSSVHRAAVWGLSAFEAKFVLRNGDVDEDNSVTVFDYAAFSDAFDTAPGHPKWNANADLDGDGAVTVFDYEILSRNFDQVGEEL